MIRFKCELFSFTASLFIVLVTTFLIDAQRNLHSSRLAFASISAAQTALLKSSVIPLNNLEDNNAIVKLIDNKPLVLIGDSTHGTHEFYQQRINISKQ